MTALNKWRFNSPNTVAFGHDTLADLGGYLDKLQASRCLVVTDPGLVQAGLADKVIAAIAEAGRQTVLFDQVQPEPLDENVNAALALHTKEHCDVIVGFGGGSAIDVGKAVAMLCTNGGSFMDYAGIGRVPRKGVPFIAIPTTAGTGSEVSIFSIMLVKESKAGVVDPKILPDVAIVDPLLSLSVPRQTKAATGVDALCHHLESLLSVNASPLCDSICLEGVAVISRHLRSAVASPANLDAHYWMSYGSMLGGYVMNLTEGAAANHGLAFALGAKFHVPHGISNAVMLPYVLQVVAKAEFPKVLLVGEAMGLPLSGMSDAEGVDATVEAVTRLVDDVGCLIPLREFGVTEKDIPALVAETNTQVRVMGHSTYQLASEEIHAIFASAL